MRKSVCVFVCNAPKKLIRMFRNNNRNTTQEQVCLHVCLCVSVRTVLFLDQWPPKTRSNFLDQKQQAPLHKNKKTHHNNSNCSSAFVRAASGQKSGTLVPTCCYSSRAEEEESCHSAASPNTATRTHTAALSHSSSSSNNSKATQRWHWGVRGYGCTHKTHSLHSGGSGAGTLAELEHQQDLKLCLPQTQNTATQKTLMIKSFHRTCFCDRRRNCWQTVSTRRRNIAWHVLTVCVTQQVNIFLSRDMDLQLRSI